MTQPAVGALSRWGWRERWYLFLVVCAVLACSEWGISCVPGAVAVDDVGDTMVLHSSKLVRGMEYAVYTLVGLLGLRALFSAQFQLDSIPILLAAVAMGGIVLPRSHLDRLVIGPQQFSQETTFVVAWSIERFNYVDIASISLVTRAGTRGSHSRVWIVRSHDGKRTEMRLFPSFEANEDVAVERLKAHGVVFR